MSVPNNADNSVTLIPKIMVQRIGEETLVLFKDCTGKPKKMFLFENGVTSTDIQQLTNYGSKWFTAQIRVAVEEVKNRADGTNFED